MNEDLFEQFWLAGMRKCNKKKAKSLFNSLLKKQDNAEEFVQMLIDDIQQRLIINQLGFDQMHPTTYLNGERWNDEVISNENNQRPSQQRLTAPERVREKIRIRQSERASSSGNGEALDLHDGHLRPEVLQPVRGGAERGLDDAIEGDYTEAD